MNREEIMKILPHRDDMLLLDDAEYVNGEAVGHYTVRDFSAVGLCVDER